ncbi:MAG: hypothetical protein ACRDSH_01925, partial [Pseudonocardiaceae bacterium]
MIPSLRRIAEATGKPKDLGTLAAALARVDPAEAATLLRRAYDQASTIDDHQIASVVGDHLVSLLGNQGKLREALTLSDQILEHSRQAGSGPWTQLSEQGQRLRIFSMLGHHAQVLTDLPMLRARMEELPDELAGDDRANSWAVREYILNIGVNSAGALERWQEALDLNKEVIELRRRRGASAHDTARTQFNSYGVLLRLGRTDEAEQVLRACREVFEAVGDITSLPKIYAAYADLERLRGHLEDALTLQRTALRLAYVSPEPRALAAFHDGLAFYLRGVTELSAEQRAHRLASALLHHFVG